MTCSFTNVVRFASVLRRSSTVHVRGIKTGFISFITASVSADLQPTHRREKWYERVPLINLNFKQQLHRQSQEKKRQQNTRADQFLLTDVANELASLATKLTLHPAGKSILMLILVPFPTREHYLFLWWVVLGLFGASATRLSFLF